MTSSKESEQKLQVCKIWPYEYVSKFYDHTWGYIVLRLGTGNNIELLHIKTFEKRKGFGRALFYRMLERIKGNPPYHSIFGFTRVGNTEAQNFYGALGFNLQRVDGLYKDGEAILFSQSYEKLLEEKERYEDSLRS